MSMEIKASQVKELRDMTGVAMMDCKKALVDCEGDIERALDLLRSTFNNLSSINFLASS